MQTAGVQTRNVITCLLACVAVAGCGGGGSSDGSPVLAPSPPASVSVTTVPAFTSLPTFSQPLALLKAPGDSRWYVLERAGRIYAFADDPAADSISLILDLRSSAGGPVNSSSSEQGLLGMAFDPDYDTSRTAYLSYTRADGASVLARINSTDNGQTLNAATLDPLLIIPQPASNHNGGQLAFGPDELLYLGIGDGGGSNDPGQNAQDTSTLLGAMLRVDVRGGAMPYGIPPGNPFQGNSSCPLGTGGGPCPEIFAWGLRNPWRWSFDRVTGLLWAGDVGQGNWEEIDIIAAGNNYGWRDREGAHCNLNIYPADNCPVTGFTEPVTEYSRGSGGSVTGGYIYRGTQISGLTGSYVFGDFVTGRIYRYAGDTSGNGITEELMDTSFGIVSFAETSSGELLLIDYFTGRFNTLVAGP